MVDTREVTSVLKRGVDQPGHTKHLGVIARAPWRVSPLPYIEDQPWVLPVQVTGPVPFTVLAVWALGPTWVPGGLSYAAQTSRVVSDVLPSIDGAVVLAGDLNAPVASIRGSERLHADTVRRLATHGLVSAYTTSRGDEVDPLDEPTLYHAFSSEKRFHIDHVFLPKDWSDGVDVMVGSYADWVQPKFSDHVPLIVDVPLPALSRSGARLPLRAG
jgi:exodeoxyribonuclease-3